MKHKKTNIVFTVTSDFSCAADGGGNINNSGVNIVPTVVNDTTTANYIKRTIKVNPTITTTGKTIYMDLWLDVNSIGTGLSESVNFKYALTTSSTNPNTGVVSTGNFNGKTANSKVYLLSEKDYNAATTDTYYLWIWLDAAETSTTTMNQTFSLSLNGSCYDQILIDANKLINRANPSTLSYNDATTAEKGEMWTFSHATTTQVPATTDYRYIGNIPNNYITFNNETWRIIGVFDDKIKIIKDTTIGNISRDFKQNGVGSSTSDLGSNDWSDSQLMYMLNPTTYTLKSGYTLNGDYIKDSNNNIIYQLNRNPYSIATGATSYSGAVNNWSLNETALSQVATTTYYLGEISSSTGSANNYYNFEIGTTVYSGRPTNWTGQVALMYPSDYAYTFANGVDDTCFNNGNNCSSGVPSSSWLYKSGTYQWLLSPYSGSATYAFRVVSSGIVGNYYYVYRTCGVAPVIYLKSDIKLQRTGTSSDPYVIS